MKEVDQTWGSGPREETRKGHHEERSAHSRHLVVTSAGRMKMETKKRRMPIDYTNQRAIDLILSKRDGEGTLAPSAGLSRQRGHSVKLTLRTFLNDSYSCDNLPESTQLLVSIHI